MTDDQLTRELERRSEGASLGRDWARYELLPAVNVAIDTHPQRVSTSRGPALAGLAGVVGILLVLVVALPRVVPGPSATSSSPAPAVWDATAFEARLASGELGGQTVVVDGRIRRYDGEGTLYGTVCELEPELPVPPGSHGNCEMGRLDGITQSVWVDAPYVETLATEATTFAHAGGWSWRAAQSPVEGRLVLSVSTAGVVGYVGKVIPSNREPISVGEVSHVAIDTLSPTDIALVKGWLWSPEAPNSQVLIDCVSPLSSPIPGLPNDYCQPHDSLLDATVPPGSVSPPDPRLNVQRNAARRYGVDDGQPHIFALAPRLYGGGCVGQPPCLHWEVVARLADSPGQIREPTPSPNTSVAPNGIAVMTTAEFADALQAGSLSGSTVVVQANVVFGPPIPRPVCFPQDNLCYLGQIEGTDPPIELGSHFLPVPQDYPGAERYAFGGWETWHRHLYVDGPIVVTVTGTIGVEYLGTAGALVSSTAADLQQRDINSVDLDQVAIVDGWLTGNLLVPPCRAPAEGTYIASLPGRWCGGPDWVVDEPTSFAPGSLIPEGGIAVQDGAYEAFAPNPTQGVTVGEPRQGQYLLARRLEGGGCPNDSPPCWQWEVVGRLSDAPPPATTSPTPDTTGPAISIDCPGTFHLTLVDLSGEVVSCSALGELDYHQVGQQLLNPDGDLSRLQIRWGLNICVASAAAEFSRTENGYTVVVTDGSGSPDCRPFPSAQAFELALSGPLAAESVTVHVIPVPAPIPTGTTGPATPAQCSDPPSSTHWPPHVTIQDETGLIEACEAVDPSLANDSIQIANVVGDMRILRVMWTGSPCDGTVDFRFGVTSQESPRGYVLDGQTSWDDCIMPRASFEIRLFLRSGVDAGQVTPTLSHVQPPAPTPSPPDPGARVLECPYADSFGRATEIRFIDHTGSVTGCSAATDQVTTDSLVVQDGHLPLSLDVTWLADSSVTTCHSRPVELELWRPEKRSDYAQGSYVLRVALLTGSEQTPCAAPTTQTASLALGVPIAAGDVGAFVTDESSIGHQQRRA